MTKANENLYRLARISNNEEAVAHFESMITVDNMKNFSKKTGNFSTANYSCEYRVRNEKESFHFFDRTNGTTIAVNTLKRIIG